LIEGDPHIESIDPRVPRLKYEPSAERELNITDGLSDRELAYLIKALSLTKSPLIRLADIEYERRVEVEAQPLISEVSSAEVSLKKRDRHSGRLKIL
jgi:hypothetical protein